MKALASIILAAGQGTRMHSSRAKVLHLLAGKPLLHYPLAAARSIAAERIVVVVGHQAAEVETCFAAPDLTWVTQAPQLGTGHALMCGREALEGFVGDLLLLCGDIPLIRLATLERLLGFHRQEKNAVTVLTTIAKEPTGYGRIIRAGGGDIARIVEEKDASAQERAVTEINSGIYCFDAAFVFSALDALSRHNAQNEYYLTDTVAIAAGQGRRVGGVLASSAEEVMGINTRIDLARAYELLRREVLERLMLAGVTIIDPHHTYVEPEVWVGKDTVIYPNSHFCGATRIGEGCVIEPGCRIVASTLGDRVVVKSTSVIEESVIREGASIGPFAHLRPQSDIGEGARIGNFVEVKKSIVGRGSKASHLTYLGDATIGAGVNVGAGTITCNYDGVAKHPTIIEDEVFVGSNTELVAPVRVGKGALIGAGSTITKDVPPESLAIARARQVNLPRKPLLGKKSGRES